MGECRCGVIGETVLYKIHFYKDKQENQPVLEYMLDLQKQHDKDSRIKIKKIRDYINILATYGVSAGEPYIKHIEGEIWELRPLRDRIFFVAWNGNSFILLHHFMKKTQKTPKAEIEKAKRELTEIKESGNYK